MLFETTSLTAVLLTTMGWLPTGTRWSTSQFPIDNCISANSQNTNVGSSAQRQAVLNAINAWVAQGSGGSLSCSTYQAVEQGGTCAGVINTQDGQHNIFWESQWQSGSGTIGITWSVGSGYSCGSVTDDTGQSHGLQCFYGADIEFNDVHYYWTDTTNLSGTSTDIGSIAVHEYGHFIGLDHCNDNGTCYQGSAVMYAAYAGGVDRVPWQDDVQGACALYPGTPGGLGWPCSGNGECSSGICIDPGASGYCTQACGSCPSGYSCETNPQNASQTVCLRDDGRNKDLCEVCQQGVQGACANNGICMRSLPEASGGRCVTPCPNPGATDGDCPTNYTCYEVTFQQGGSGDFCFPKSNDCNDPSNFTELPLGARCTGNPPCVAGLTCVGICAQPCDPGVCPNDYGCVAFQGGDSYCLPSVDEGDECEGLVSCGVGPCLVNPANQQATCYLDCAGNPSACNNAQQCNTYNLSGGGQVSICEPPGVPPLRPDAGTIDTGVTPPPDTGVDGGVVVNPDATINPPTDTGVHPQKDSGTNPTCGCDQTYACDPNCDCDPECGGTCDCDQTFCCDPDCACDPECPCACDLTTVCDPNCECDPECCGGSAGGDGFTSGGCGECTATEDSSSEGYGLFFGLLLLAFGIFRFSLKR